MPYFTTATLETFIYSLFFYLFILSYFKSDIFYKLEFL